MITCFGPTNVPHFPYFLRSTWRQRRACAMLRRYNQAAGPAHYQNSPKCEFRSNASILRPGIPKVPPEPPSKFEENCLEEDIQGDVVSFL